MKETLYRFLGERNPRAKARYEALRQAGEAMEKGMGGLTGGLDLSLFGI